MMNNTNQYRQEKTLASQKDDFWWIRCVGKYFCLFVNFCVMVADAN
jgi:hypothetical protein